MVMAKSMEDLSTILEDLHRVSQRMDLKMDMDKTNRSCRMCLTLFRLGILLFKLLTRMYLYLEQTVQLGRSNFDKEFNRRIQLGWAAVGKLRDVFSTKFAQCLRRKSLTNV